MPNPDPDPDPSQLNWTLIPEELATANLSRVGPSTVWHSTLSVWPHREARRPASGSVGQLVWLGAPSCSQARTWALSSEILPLHTARLWSLRGSSHTTRLTSLHFTL